MVEEISQKMEGNSVCNKSAVYFMISFRQLCIVTVSLPLCALLICFVTAYIFQQDDIHETHCRVYNVIPSISAITGVSPQRYLWRVCVAFHIGPRIIIASMYRTYYHSLLSSQSPGPNHPGSRGYRLLNVAYWLSLVEIAALCGVTYISNRENYPVHEKIFMVFMFGSLSYMLATIKVFRLVKPNMSDTERNSYLIKKGLFATSIVSTVGLCIFFLKHRLLCHDMAFSWFSFCEYLIASANMAFHMTVVLDFPTEQLIVAQGSPGMVLVSSTTATQQQQEHHWKSE
ncbi:post-GPI attachment to proteins factor 2-like [Cryptotermes secundus]|uniref:post-GPI attachment to proteins factor 2-like n=1 Tax=Cryptotermes secundus TaxID=105785 RepID=UPI000CD7D8F1|nr:post-GPI attachment to proteins factor 2-like [Cryptotermes secundus]